VFFMKHRNSISESYTHKKYEWDKMRFNKSRNSTECIKESSTKEPKITMHSIYLSFDYKERSKNNSNSKKCYLNLTPFYFDKNVFSNVRGDKICLFSLFEFVNSELFGKRLTYLEFKDHLNLKSSINTIQQNLPISLEGEQNGDSFDKSETKFIDMDKFNTFAEVIVTQFKKFKSYTS